MATDVPRILLIDSYDSFTFNLAALCRRSIPNCCIHIVKNDQLNISELLPHLDAFSAVVVGPGPGSPDNPRDIGLVRDLWKLQEQHLIPVFGVCLGLQSLAIEHGAQLKRLRIVKHGQISQIHHHGTELFKGVTEVAAVRYHSLHVELAGQGDVEELAWADDGEENGRVVMAVKHKAKPFWAVQYHPESVRTDGGGEDVVRNFWRLAQNWARQHGRVAKPCAPDSEDFVGPSWPPVSSAKIQDIFCPLRKVQSRILHVPDLSVVDVAEHLGASDEASPFVMLDSASRPGRYSVIGSLFPFSPRLVHYLGEDHISIVSASSTKRVLLGSQDVWSWTAAYMQDYRATDGHPDSPFWGGLVGYLSYELGCSSICVEPSADDGLPRHPDLSLVLVERSIVFDMLTGTVFVQSIVKDDSDWLQLMQAALEELAKRPPSPTAESHVHVDRKRRRTVSKRRPSITLPDKDVYLQRIHEAQEHLNAGNSYEICLTAQTRIDVPKQRDEPGKSSSWEFYRTLRQNNPAPHSAYLRLHPSTVLCSSPERFLSFSRAPQNLCQLRPIKGTVRKAPGVTRAVATEALIGSVKEVAENLMIVDLIRHDLHAVVGENVVVRQFCKVEEYETVWQLVSVIEGQPAAAAESSEGDFGWQVLRQSLPPGSMTGAPKKRSVEILQGLEDGRRGIYSGVLGYWDVGGGGDWSVIIRTCFKLDQAGETRRATINGAAAPSSSRDQWFIGAGGAITALSDPDAEWDEMTVKLQSALRAFSAS